MKRFISLRGGEGLSRPDAAEFIDSLMKRIDEERRRLSHGEQLALLEDVLTLVATLREGEEEDSRRFSELVAEAGRAGTVEFQEIAGRFRTFAAAQFLRRRSLGDFLRLSVSFRDLLLSTLLKEAAALAGVPADRVSLLVSGRGGRFELAPCDGNDILIIPAADGGDAAGVAAALSSLLAPLDAAGGGIARAAATGAAQLLDNFGFAFCADLRFIAGDDAAARVLLAAVREEVEGRGEELRRLMREDAALPLAVGRLGMLRVERGGERRGELDLRRYTIEPLVRMVRGLALQHRLEATFTPDRIRGLLAAGKLDVAMTERLLRAFHAFLRIEITALAKGVAAGEGCLFVDPEELGEEELRRLREGVEAVEILQKMVYSSVAWPR